MWEANAGINEEDIALIQDYMMGTSQLKAPTPEGGPQRKIPAIGCEHLRLARPSNELCLLGRNKLQATLGP